MSSLIEYAPQQTDEMTSLAQRPAHRLLGRPPRHAMESCTHLWRRYLFRVALSHGGYLAAELHVMGC